MSPIYVAENGPPMTETTERTDGDDINDTSRIAYLAAHLREAGRAIQAGAPLRGYFVWCLFDTFEWNYGYRPRFGIVHVERPALRRVPKRSALWYRDTIASAP